jgi:hypothetical protein
MKSSNAKPRKPVREQRPATIDTNQIYRIEEAAAALSMSRAQFFVVLRDGLIPTVKLGRRTLVSGAAIVAAATAIAAGTFARQGEAA